MGFDSKQAEEVLKWLIEILAKQSSSTTDVSSISSDIASLLAKFTGTHTLTSNVVGTGGTVTAGAYSVAFTPVTGFTGTINGQAITDETPITFTASMGKTLPAISYTVTGGNLRIDTIV